MLGLIVEIEQIMLRNFPNVPTIQQKDTFKVLGEFLTSVNPNSCFVLNGYAGTGKTSIIAALVRSLPYLNMRSVLLAPTGRAAKIMSAYSGRSAFTIHKRIYRKKTSSTSEMNFVLSENRYKDAIFVVDEASMLSDMQAGFNKKSLLEDLVSFVMQGENCRLMFVGDIAQLPPIGLVESPALNPDFLRATYRFEIFSQELSEVVRQEEHSGILFNATQIRQHLQNLTDHHNPSYPEIKVAGFKDIFKMSGEHLIEGLHYAYKKYGVEETLVICRSNKHANLFNQHIRNQIFFYEDELTGGDHVMVVRNNYYWAEENEIEERFIANGDMAIVRRVRNVHEQYGFRFADVSLSFLDHEEMEPLNCRVLLNTLYIEAPSLPQTEQQTLFDRILEDYAHIANKRDRLAAMKKDPYLNALQIKFAMAVTCHKAQGGQWKAVFVDQGYLNDEMLNSEFLRWLYTACTRATKELFLLNFHRNFFKKN